MQTAPSMLAKLLFMALIVAGIICISQNLTLPAGVGAIDFVQYWSSGRAMLMGLNPYDPAVLEVFQRPVMPTLAEVTRMWNPPAMLTLSMPLAFFSFEWARSLWWLLQITMIISSFHISAKLLALSRSEWRFGILFLLISAPTHSTLAFGQIAPLLLLGWISFLALYEYRPYSSGLLLSLTLLKPHLLLLNYLALILSGSWRVLKGMLSGILALSLLPFVIQPEILKWYSQAVTDPPIYWFTASLGAWTQFAAVEWAEVTETTEKMIFRFLPVLVGGLVVLCRASSFRPVTSVTFLTLAPWSLALSPYGWVYDQLLLLPTILMIMRDSLRGERFLCLLLLIFSCLLQMLTPGSIGQAAAVWFPIYLGMLAWVVHSTSRSSTEGLNSLDRAEVIG